MAKTVLNKVDQQFWHLVRTLVVNELNELWTKSRVLFRASIDFLGRCYILHNFIAKTWIVEKKTVQNHKFKSDEDVHFFGIKKDKSFDPMTILCLESWYFGQIKEVKPTLKDQNQKQKQSPVGLTPMTRKHVS